MADVPDPDPIRSPWGNPFDPPATAADCATGKPGTTLFSLLKGILVLLAAANESPGGVGGPS